MHKFLFLWVFLSGSPLPLLVAQTPSDWKMVLDSAGMKVFLQEDQANHELSCKVVTELQCDVPEAMDFFREFGNYAKWITGCESATTLRQRRENHLYGRLVYKPEYSETPGTQEDAVIRIILHKAGESWVGNFSAMPDEFPEQEGFVRQKYLSANWALVKRNTGVCVFTYTAKVVSNEPPGSPVNNRFVRDNYASVLTLRELLRKTTP